MIAFIKKTITVIKDWLDTYEHEVDFLRRIREE